jgi:hypothetical protein
MKNIKISLSAFNKFFKITSFILATSLLLLACKKEKSAITDNKTKQRVVSTAKINPTLHTENGVMVFATEQDFNEEVMNT